MHARPLAALLLLCGTTTTAFAAEKLIATIAGPNFTVPGSGNTQMVSFKTDQPVTGVGFTANWSAVVADFNNGVAPWSLDLGVTVTAPDGSIFLWKPIGGEVSIADYPLQDFKRGFAGVDGSGTFTWAFTSFGPPWVAGLSDVQYHLTTEVPDVVQTFTGSVAQGPLWSRPFSIVGISGLGPVVYEVMEFAVEVSGGYEIETVVASGNTFNYLYRGGFDPAQPLQNLLDYGLGNGNHYTGAPAGTGRISALLFEGETYFLVVSQWSATSPGQSFTTTVVGPGAFIDPNATRPGDLNGDGLVDGADLGILLGQWGACPPKGPCGGDLDGDGSVGGADLGILLGNWGSGG